MKFITVFNIDTACGWSALPDSVGLPTDRPLFVPDFPNGAVVLPAVAVKIARLGKCIERRFAQRYWNVCAPALITLPSEEEQTVAKGEAPPVASLCFDSAVVTGDWIETRIPDFRFTISGEEAKATADTDLIDRAIETLSFRNTLKTGDVILFPTLTPHHLTENDIIHGGTDSTTLLRTKIK